MASTKDYDELGAGLSFNRNIYSMDCIQPYFKDKIICFTKRFVKHITFQNSQIEV